MSAAGIDLDGGVGERDYRPTSVVDLRDTYELGMGELIVDLRQTDLPAGDVPLDVDLGVGEARVIVPEDVCVATDAEVGIGEVRSFGRHNEGVDVDFDDLPEAAPDVTRLLVKADVGDRLAPHRPVRDRPRPRQRPLRLRAARPDLGENSACAA